MGDLTANCPKPLLKIAGKNLLEHKLDILPPQIDEVILIIGYLGEQIKKYFGDNYHGRKINYVEQKELNGSGGAFWLLKDLIKEKCLVLMGDDLYSAEDISQCIKEDWAILLYKTEEPIYAAKVELNWAGQLVSITEAAEKHLGNLLNTGLYVLQPEIFNYPLVEIKKGEYGLPQTLALAAKDFPVQVHFAKFWLKINEPPDLLIAENHFKK